MPDFTRLLSETLVAVAARATNRYGKRDRNENNKIRVASPHPRTGLMVTGAG